MRLTKRCMEILTLLRDARWLSTSQLHRRFFPHATLNAARKRLRRLAQAGYLRKFQEGRMQEAMFTLGNEGRRELERKGWADIVLVRQPPKQREHMTGINDVRIAAEITGHLEYFFSAWELPGAGWNHPIIPDAVMRLKNKSFAVEFDRGLESIGYFVKTKITVYRSGLQGLPLAAVIVVADGKARMNSLARAIGGDSGRVLFTTIDLIRRHGMLAAVFYSGPDREGVRLF